MTSRKGHKVPNVKKITRQTIHIDFTKLKKALFSLITAHSGHANLNCSEQLSNRTVPILFELLLLNAPYTTKWLKGFLNQGHPLMSTTDLPS